MTGKMAGTVTARLMVTMTSNSKLEAGTLCGRQALSSVRAHNEQVCFATVASLPLTRRLQPCITVRPGQPCITVGPGQLLEPGWESAPGWLPSGSQVGDELSCSVWESASAAEGAIWHRAGSLLPGRWRLRGSQPQQARGAGFPLLAEGEVREVRYCSWTAA